MATRPSTSGYETTQSPLETKIKRSLSFKKEKVQEIQDAGDTWLEITLKKFTTSATDGDRPQVQMYYKSIEPYFKKKKHVSGYEAETIPQNEDSSSSKSSKSSVILSNVLLKQ